MNKINRKYNISLIPYEKLRITSLVELEDIKTSLGNKLEWTEIFGMSFHKTSDKKYEGWIRNKEFKLRRILKGGINSFIPIVSGKIFQETDKLKVSMTIKLHWFVSFFLLAFIIFSLILFDTDNIRFSLLFMILPYFISVVFFNIESKIVKADLIDLFLKTKDDKK